MGGQLVFGTAILCLAGLLSVHAQELNNKRVLSYPSNRILNGTAALPNQIPYQAAVLEKREQVCGGSIFDEKHVLTAASCVMHANKTLKSIASIQIGVGDNDINTYYFNYTTTHNVTKIIVHKDYNVQNKNRNIAVITIADRFKFSASVFPVPLASAAPKLTTECVVSGWGKIWTSPLAPNMHNLYYAHVNLTACPSSAAGTLCATRNTTGLCESDAGGPLVCNEQLVGVLSSSTCLMNETAVFTNVPDHIKWIEESLGVNQDKSFASSSKASFAPVTLLVVLLYCFCWV